MKTGGDGEALDAHVLLIIRVHDSEQGEPAIEDGVWRLRRDFDRRLVDLFGARETEEPGRDRIKKGIIAGVCALALGAAFSPSFAQAQEKTLRVAHYGFNPQKGRFEMAFGSQSTLPLMAFADSLTFLNPDGSVDPGLATSWSVTDDTT